MENNLFTLIANIVTLLAAVISAIMLIKIIFRTKKELDYGFRYLLAVSFIYIFYSIVYISKVLALSSLDFLEKFFYLLHLLIIILFTFGVYEILKTFSSYKCGYHEKDSDEIE